MINILLMMRMNFMIKMIWMKILIYID